MARRGSQFSLRPFGLRETGRLLMEGRGRGIARVGLAWLVAQLCRQSKKKREIPRPRASLDAGLEQGGLSLP